MKLTFFLLFLTSSLLFSAGELSHRRAPGFSIVDATQQQHDLADYRGKYLIIDFMQTTCLYCIGFAEVIEKLMVDYRGKLSAVSIVLSPDNLNTVTAISSSTTLTSPFCSIAAR